MKHLKFYIIVFFISHTCQASKLPEEISSAFTEENNSHESEFFVNYMKSNWRWITQEIEVLPLCKGGYDNSKDAFNGSVMILAQACENLTGLEYVDFLDQIVILYEKKMISSLAFRNAILNENLKTDFLSVNYEHPRVAAILSKAKQLVSVTDVDLASCFDDMAKGELADTYMYEKSDDAPLPETLPGVKLKRPFDSIIKKYEKITGKKYSDLGGPISTNRPVKRGASSQGVEELPVIESSHPWTWGISALLVVLTSYGVMRLRKRRI